MSNSVEFLNIALYYYFFLKRKFDASTKSTSVRVVSQTRTRSESFVAGLEWPLSQSIPARSKQYVDRLC